MTTVIMTIVLVYLTLIAPFPVLFGLAGLAIGGTEGAVVGVLAGFLAAIIFD